MRNILEYPITQEEKTRFVDNMFEGVGSTEPLILSMFAIEFATWLWTTAVEYMRGGYYTVTEVSGLDVTNTYTIEQLYAYWLNNIWKKT